MTFEDLDDLALSVGMRFAYSPADKIDYAFSPDDLCAYVRAIVKAVQGECPVVGLLITDGPDSDYTGFSKLELGVINLRVWEERGFTTTPLTTLPLTEES